MSGNPLTWREAFYWGLGMFLDETHKPSMSRIMLALWTWLGWLMVHHELVLSKSELALSNATWDAWWAAEGVLALAVFGPRVASYFTPGAAGASAATAIGTAMQKAIDKVEGKWATQPVPQVPITPTDPNSGAEGG